MPRNASGTYSLPTGNPVESGTVIQSTWANSTLNDVASALTDSLSRAGNGGMLAPFYFTNGTVSEPSISFTTENSSGLYLPFATDVRMTITGTDVMRWSAGGVAQIYKNSIWENILISSDIGSFVNPGTADTQTLRWDNANLKWIPSDVLKTGLTGVTVNGSGGLLVQGTGGISVTGNGGLSVTGTAGLLSTGAGTNSFRAGTSAGSDNQGASSIAIGG